MGKRYQQPQIGPLAIDWSNPFCKPGMFVCIPALAKKNLANSLDLTVIGAAPASPFITLRPTGTELSFSTSGASHGWGGLRQPSAWPASGGFTLIWVGTPQYVGATGAMYGNLLILGADGFGNGWQAALYIDAGVLKGTYVDSSPAAFTTSFTPSPALAVGVPARLAFRSNAARGTVYDYTSRTKSSVSGGTGTLRSSTFGVGISAVVSDGTAGGNNDTAIAIVLPYEADDDTVWSLLKNPWQIFKSSPLVLAAAAAGGNTTITCSVGNAASAGVNAIVSPSVVCTVGNVAATGISAIVSMSVVCSIGATAATGVSALLNTSDVCTVGATSATGVNASISFGSNTTITCAVGASAATGVNALVSPSVVCAVGATSATGVSAQVSRSIVCSVGATAATGVNAQISISDVCTVGNVAATGVNCAITIPGNQTITCSIGNAAAATAAALISIGVTASVANAAAAGVAATITKAITCSIGNANATGVSSTIIALTNTTLVCTVGNSIASGVKAVLVGFGVSTDPISGSRVVFGTPERRVAIPQFSQTVSHNRPTRTFT